MEAARDAKIGLLSTIEDHKTLAMAKAMASKHQIAAQVEDLSGSPRNDLTADWERLDKFRYRLHPKELGEPSRFRYDMVLNGDAQFETTHGRLNGTD